MKIFKENSYDIVRLYVNQLGIMIFSMLLYTAVGSFENARLSTALSIFVSIFSLCFYLVLIYYVVWEIGAKDKIRIEGGRAEPCKFKGLVMGLFANVPNFVLGILTLLFLSIFLISGNNVVSSVFLIFNLITRFHASMYLGIISAIVPTGLSSGPVDYIEMLVETLLFVVLPLISVGVTHLAYYLGSKEKKLISFITNK
jgi:hypothetical protein